ncbi:MAG: RHS repeat protein [Proteobacteria bacterium]|nr:RHS repeat protein [Pseudomonadota bacterium]
MRFVRTYNYLGTNGGATSGSLGPAWTHTYDRRLKIFPSGAVQSNREDGTSNTFLLSGSSYTEYGTAVDHLTAITDGAGLTIGYQLVDQNDTRENYDVSGVLQSIVTRSGQTQTLTYSTSTTPPSIAPSAGLLISVADDFGHALQLTYNASAQIATVTDPSGGSYSYTYTNGLLTGVSYPDGNSRSYVYNEGAQTQSTNLPFALTGILDETGTRFATFGWNSYGQAVSSVHAGGVDQTTLSSSYYSFYGYGVASVTDALGVSRSFNYSNVNGVVMFTGVHTLCSTCGDAPYSVGYDANGNVSSRMDFIGYSTTYVNDLTRNLETSRTEAAGTARARTITTTWNPTYREPATITEPNRTTSYTYDTAGNRLTKTITDTTVTPNVARTWTYTYDTYGRTLTADGPRTDVSDVTTYTYYTCNTGNECGQLHTVTNAAGQTTTFNTYNGSGQPLTLTDPNGVVTTLTYDSRQRLTSRQAGSETTLYDYWPTGLLKKVTLPDASYLLYTYDAAHRLTQISDALGNSIQYTLDAIGNRTAENTYDPSNALHRTHSRVFNSLSQLYKDVNAAGTTAVTTTFGYDANGNQTTVAAPLSRNTTNAYDELNRLKQITDPASGITKFGYDANDNLTSVTDPRSLVTNYTYSGFGDLATQVSPDTGTTTKTYDSGGNLATSTDARSAVSTYTYDALNRVTSVAYSLGGTTDQTIAFTYDAGTNGKGHLTGASDANHSLSWTYDPEGRVTGKSQIVGSVAQSIGYGYTNANLTSLTTPSGQVITYGYNGNHQVTSVAVNGITVLNSVTYEPLGPVSGWTWGNGTTTARSYDTDGKISQITSAGTKTYSYDDAFRITGVTDTSLGASNWTYGYDSLDRLTSGTSPSITRGWTYDANGNRLTESGTAPSTYTISSTSNRISGITGTLARTYAYDAAGNTTGYSTVNASYNNAGRLKTLANSTSTETAIYNALGQRAQISGGASGTVLYAYDEAGHLLGEYDGTGALIEETVWLGDTPVATLRPNGATVTIYYVHSDQLNSPRQVTRPSDNSAMWTWNSDPFGTDAANPNPSGAGSFPYNLRFPGQLFDRQVGLHYNYFRDFDPAIGRYGESDPLGLKAGINTYAYVLDNPVKYVDPTGLQASTWECDGNGNYVPVVVDKDPCTAACTKAHEEQHIADAKEKFGTGLCRNKPPHFRPTAQGNQPPGYDTAYNRKTECRAYRTEEACLKTVEGQMRM